jgi:parvulin-like peptidyl-prolyl isomerase
MLGEIVETMRLLLIAGIVLIALIAAFRLFGLKGLGIALAALATAALYLLGRRDGRDRIIEKERADVGRAERQADQARVDARVRDADPERLRQSDGFRRD